MSTPLVQLLEHLGIQGRWCAILDIFASPRPDGPERCCVVQSQYPDGGEAVAELFFSRRVLVLRTYWSSNSRYERKGFFATRIQLESSTQSINHKSVTIWHQVLAPRLSIFEAERDYHS